jgi:hypothetical protein
MSRIEGRSPEEASAAAEAAQAQAGASEGASAEAAGPAASPARGGKGESGLAARARMGGQIASTDAKPAADFTAAAQDKVQSVLSDNRTGTRVEASALPKAAEAKLDGFQKGADVKDQGKPFAWKTSVDGEPVFVVQEGDKGAFLLSLFDKNGKSLGDGEINSDEDMGINW